MDDLKLYGNSEKEAERLTKFFRNFPKDFAMEFGISKCAHVKTKAGKLVSVGGMELPSGDTEIKDKILKEYYRRLKQLTSSKLSGGNTIRVINSWNVS